MSDTPIVPANLANKINIEIDSSLIDSDLTNFPITIVLGDSSGTTSTDLSDFFTEMAYSTDDNFTGTDGDDPDTIRWEFSYSGDVGGSAEIQSNTLAMGHDTAITANELLYSKFQLVGDFDIQVDFSELYWSDSNYRFGFLVNSVSGSELTNYYGGICRYPDSTGYYRAMTYTPTDDFSGVTYEDTSGKFRLVRTGSSLDMSYWDGSAWIIQNTDSAYGDFNVFVCILSGSWGDSICTGVFDNFLINSADGIIWPDGEPNRKKVKITTVDGTECFAEIEGTPNFSDKKIVYHVKVPEISSTKDTICYLEYDSSMDDNDNYIGDTGVFNTVTNITGDDFTGTDGDLPNSLLWTIPTKDTTVINNNKLRLALNGGEADYICSKFAIDGDFDIQINLAIISGSATLNWAAMFDVIDVDDSTNKAHIFFTKNTIVCRTYIDGTANQNNYTTSASNFVFRITRVGNIWQNSYSIDSGITWSSQVATSGMTTNRVKIQLSQSFWSTTPSAVVDFDNLIINSGTVKFSPAKAVWDSNYKAVYHMAQDPSGTSPQLLDSLNINNGTSSGTMTSTDLVDGPIGKAIKFDGTDDYFDLNDNLSDFSFIANTMVFTIECNVAISDLSSRQRFLGSSMTEQDHGFNFAWETYNSSYGDHALAFNVGSGVSRTVVATHSNNNATIMDNDTHYCVVKCVEAGNKVDFLVDGIKLTTTDRVSFSGVATGDDERTLLIGAGNYSTIGGFFDGDIGEVRISDIARSDDWIKATQYAFADDLLTFSIIESVDSIIVIKPLEEIYNIYDIESLSILSKIFTQPYSIATYIEKPIEEIYNLFYVIINDLYEIYGLKIAKTVTQWFGDVTVRKTIIDEYYDDTQLPLRTIKLPYGDKLNSKISVIESYKDAPIVNLPVSELYEDILNPIIQMVEFYKDAPSSNISITEKYNDAKNPIKSVIESYKDKLTLKRNFSETWDFKGSVIVNINEPFSITSHQIVNVFEFEYSIENKNKVSAIYNCPYYMLSEISIEGDVDISIFVNGISIDFTSINISGGMDKYTLFADIGIASLEDYINCPLLGDVECIIDGIPFNFFIENRSQKKSNSGMSWTLSLVSPTVKLDSPYSKTMIESFEDGIYASELVQQMADYQNIVVDWQIIDWSIPSYAISASDETPLEVIKKVVNSVGAIIQTKPNGDMLIISQYPISPTLWETEVPSIVFSSEVNIVSLDESITINDGYNAYIITDQGTSTADITLEEVVISSTKKIIRGFRVPFTDGEFDLVTSGGPEIFINKTSTAQWATIPIDFEDSDSDDPAEWEYVEFIDWVGTTQYPIYEIVEWEWVSDDMGSFQISESGTLTVINQTDTLKESLLRIKYKTKYWEWFVQGPIDRHTQFYVPEIEIV